MFGYVITNENTLSPEQKELYRAHYCGVCRALGTRHGTKASATLSYEMTFLSLFLCSVYEQAEEETSARCFLHPTKKHLFRYGIYTDYAADMNLLLTYYKYIDDWRDSSNIPARAFAGLFEKECEKIKRDYPRQAGVMEDRLRELDCMEKKDERNPDLPAAVFGELLADVFIFQEDEREPALRDFGSALGKFIYIMDACVDLKDDIRKKRYNPLVSFSSADFEDILHLLMADTMEYYKKLDIRVNAPLIDNILFSGIWTKYEMKKRKEGPS